ncbi:MAG: acyl-CoA thioesterase, partial [Candidatus Methylumidiphilus sp.]
LKFFERARTERLRSMGFELDELRRASGILFVVRSMQINFLKPAHFNDYLSVSAEMTEVKRASLSFTQEIRKDTPKGEKLCEAVIRIACLSDTKWRPVPIPSLLLERI